MPFLRKDGASPAEAASGDAPGKAQPFATAAIAAFAISGETMQ